MSDGLGKAYAARASEDLAQTYAGWANDYDRELLSLGYCLPFIVAGFIARHVKPSDGALLDAGCGTGLSGPILAALGYHELEGLDMSPEMIAHAAARGCYGALTQAMLGKTLPYEDGRFACVFSTGTFTDGHAPAASLDELCRITRAGGHVIFTVRQSILETGGFADKMRALGAAGCWSEAETSAPFRSYALAHPDIFVRAYVFRRAAG